MKDKQLKGILILSFTAIIWGITFVFQKLAVDDLGAFSFNAIRFALGTLVIFPFALIGKVREKKKEKTDKKNYLYGILLGIVFCIASNLQQFAFSYTSTGKIAFITALYMFFVPILGYIFIKKKVSKLTWLCVILGFAGMYLLCINKDDKLSFGKGETLALACAVFFAVQILMIERLSAKINGVKLSLIEMTTGALISAVLMLVFEKPTIQSITAAIPSLLYAGIMSCGLAYTLQIVGQKYTESTIASIIMCTEAVFATIAATVFLKEIPTVHEIAGSLIMFAAIIISQMDEYVKKRMNQKRGSSSK